MALVMLPCDLPWWVTVQKQLEKIATTKNTLELIDGMQKIHEICNISLDPDEDNPDPHQFVGLLNFLDNDLTIAERSNFLNKTLPNMASRASNLRQYRPKRGLHYSLQQQPDSTELDYDLVASLLANAFFSTYPKRTPKTHPTLRDFNFSYFFKHLHKNSQKAKLKSILHYFDWIERQENLTGNLKIMRQVMSSKEWLTIEDWLECTLPLCPLQIKHDGKLDRSPVDSLNICFASTKIGRKALEGGCTQECINLWCLPELLCILLSVEALEDNEVLTIERAHRVSRVSDVKNRATLEKLENSEEVAVCCVDAEDYSELPLSQYEEDNILRELNKCLLAYQQKHNLASNETTHPGALIRGRRLSPIGESLSIGSNNEVNPNIPVITQQSCSTTRSDSPKFNDDSCNNNRLRVHLQNERQQTRGAPPDTLVNNRRGRFIVLGSSGECLPVKRRPLERVPRQYSSCDSSEEEFHSAKSSIDEDSEEDFQQRYSLDLDTLERRQTFAERLRDALRRETANMSISSESSYAVGIAIAGSGVADSDIQVKRAGSTGFMLNDDSMEERGDSKDSIKNECKVGKSPGRTLGDNKKESNKSSEYSFSTDYSSELEEVYEQFSQWLQNPILETDKGTKRTLDARDLAVVQFAGSILKRTLSESFAGVQLNDSPTDPDQNMKKQKIVLNAKSLSLELARHKHRLAAQLSQKDEPIIKKVEINKKSKKNWVATCVSDVVQTLEDVCVNFSLPKPIKNKKLSQIAQKPNNGLKPISTGNWGCGSRQKGEVQLKVVIQWLASSVAGVPSLIYYTNAHSDLASLDTLYRILRDRKWTVKDLAEATLRYSTQIIEGNHSELTLFEDLIGVAKKA